MPHTMKGPASGSYLIQRYLGPICAGLARLGTAWLRLAAFLLVPFPLPYLPLSFLSFPHDVKLLILLVTSFLNALDVLASSYYTWWSALRASLKPKSCLLSSLNYGAPKI